MRKPVALAACFLASLVSGCGSSTKPSDIPDECNPLSGTAGCMVPWPSMTYAKADPTSATGFRLDLDPAAMPVNGSLTAVSPDPYNRWDGFSPAGFALAAFPNGVGSANLPPWSDPSQSLAADSPIVLLNVDTGERYPFFAEVDQNVTVPSEADLIIRPLVRLPGGARIAVGITNQVKDPNGSDLPVSDAFAAIRDGKSFDHPRFAALAARYPAIFTALATAGYDKSNLVLAWDYVTASDAFLTNDLSTMRTQALPAIGQFAENLTFNGSAQPISGSDTYAIYYGTFTSPNFLTDGENTGSVTDSRINRDANGNPLMEGTRQANYAAFIPACVATGQFPLPRPTVVFGHGLFGTGQSYVEEPFLQNIANTLCVNMVAGDFIGLTQRQLELALLAVNDMNLAGGISEMLGQSVIDFISLENLARGPMSTSTMFQYQGTPVIDTTRIYYLGGSLGGIMGSVIMAYDNNLQRAVLAVPGGNWSLLFERSNAWFDLMGPAQGAYPDLNDYQINIALLAMAMEPYDPITTAKHLLQDPLLGNPVKNIAEWYTMGDCLVTNISTEEMARETGLTLMAPNANTDVPYDLPPTMGPLANGLVAFDDHPTPLPPTTNSPPPKDNGTHSGINEKPAAVRFAQNYLLGSNYQDECFDGSAQVACDCQGSGSPCD